MNRRGAGATYRGITISNVAALSVGIVAGTVLLGWIFDAPALKAPYGNITMKTNAALGLLVSATGLWAVVRDWRLFARACGIFAMIIGGLTLVEHLSGWDIGIDQLLFSEPAGAVATASPNRMGPNASLSLVLAGLSLWLLANGTPRSIRTAQRLEITAGAIALLAIAGYLDGAVQLYAISDYTGIALHTAMSLFVLSVGLLAARVDEGPMALLAAEGVAGTMLRRLTAPVLLTPLALGYLIIGGREADLFDRGLSIAIFSVAVISIFGAIVWHTAATVAAAEAERRGAELDRDLLLVRERQARDEAERASRLKDQFIAVLSHELRTPLNVMMGWTQVLERETSPDRHARAAAVVARNGRLLTRLVEDLLDVSRVSAGQFEIERHHTAFNQVVQNVVDALGPLARDKGLTLTATLDPLIGEIQGDLERLQQIVSNLISNAIKFTAGGGQVAVTTTIDGGWVRLTVVDTGIGFDPGIADDLFEPFRQADSSFKREYGGLGLGLSIAKHIAELHGGSLEGRSEGPGHGATFTLRLPLTTARLNPDSHGSTTVHRPAANASASGIGPM